MNWIMQEITRRRWPTIYGERIKVNLKWSGPATLQRGQQKLGDLSPAAVSEPLRQIYAPGPN